MKILLIRNDNIGDLICTTPAIEALRKRYLNAQIDIVVNSLNYCAIRGNKYIDNIFVYTKPKHKNNFFDKIKAFYGKCKICWSIWRQKYDIAVIFRSKYSSSAALFARISRARDVAGIDDLNISKKIISMKSVFNHNNEVMVCFDILKPLNVSYNKEKTLFVPCNPSDNFKNFVFFHISSREKENTMSANKIGEIVEFLKTKTSKIVITAENKEFADLISSKHCVQYFKTDSLDELANYIGAAKFVITLEGGIFHLSTALGVDTLILFGKTSVDRWAPIYGSGRCEILQDKSKRAENLDNQVIYSKILEFV